jgi:hypothetical protein
MRQDIVFYVVIALTLSSLVAAATVALATRHADPSRMAVALQLAKIAFVGAAALAAMLGSAMVD